MTEGKPDLAEERKKFEQELADELGIERNGPHIVFLATRSHCEVLRLFDREFEILWDALISARIAAYQAGLKDAIEKPVDVRETKELAGDALVAQTPPPSILKPTFVTGEQMLLIALEECVKEHDKVCSVGCSCSHSAIAGARFLVKAWEIEADKSGASGAAQTSQPGDTIKT